MNRDIAEFERRLTGRGFGELLGVRLDRLEEGACRIRLPYRPEFSRGDGVVHGGVIATLIDTADTVAAWSCADLPAEARGATVALAVNYLEGARSCDLIAWGRVVRRGRTITVSDVEVRDPEGLLIAKGPVTCKLKR